VACSYSSARQFSNRLRASLLQSCMRIHRLERSFRGWRDSRHGLCAPRAPTIKRMGRASMLVLCSRNRGRDGALTIFCARATRGLRRPSHGLMVRLGVPVGGLGEKVARSGRSLSPIPEERTSELGGSGRGQARWSPVLVQRAVSEDPRWTRAVGASLAHPQARG
jgi:hypothetical protein